MKELRDEAKFNPFLRDVGNPPKGISEYAFLMGKLGSPKERAKRIKKYVDRAKDKEGRIQINWTHLLLAALVEKGYINRILTTNFDPLIVDALAIMGQPIRTFDLNTTGKYFPGTLDPATIVYLHGQMHSLFLANTPDEMDRVQNLYPSVLQEAVQDSLLIVVGYSGDCDPVLKSLIGLPNFPCGLWWSHYSSSGGQIGDGVEELFRKHGSDCHLTEDNEDADTFMRKLVLDGMQLDLPDEVLTPITAARKSLERITSFPTKDFDGVDPVKGALEFLKRVEKEETTNESNRILQLQMAASAGDWNTFDDLRKGIKKEPKLLLSQAIGKGFLQRASQRSEKDKYAGVLFWLKESQNYGLDSINQSWLPVIWGNALADQAKFKGDTPEGDRFFAEAGTKYAEAVRIKPDMHEAFYNWGNALADQAKFKGDTPEGDRLFAEAGTNYAEAVRIKPDKYAAFYNWGAALANQAKFKGNTPEGDRLFAEAGTKYAEAVRIKPDNHEAFNNWGTVLATQAKFKGDTPEGERLFAEAGTKYADAIKIKFDDYNIYFNQACLFALQGKKIEAIDGLISWKKYNQFSSKSKIDKDSDFNKIKETDEFVNFRETLPD